MDRLMGSGRLLRLGTQERVNKSLLIHDIRLSQIDLIMTKTQVRNIIDVNSRPINL